MPLATGDIPTYMATTNVYADGSAVATQLFERIGPLACPFRTAGLSKWKITKQSSVVAKERTIRCEATKVNFVRRNGVRIKLTTHGWYKANSRYPETYVMMSVRPPKGVSLGY
jgi:hypothetical protein